MERIESLLNDIPGYTGYRDKERRRDSDRRLRESIAAQLGSVARRVERGGATLAGSGNMTGASKAEALVRALDHAASRVRAQSYGYGGIFSDRPVDEHVLDTLYLFDRGLSRKVTELDEQLSAIESDLAATADVDAVVASPLALVQSLLDQLDARSAVVETSAPPPVRSVFEALPAEAAKHEPPAITLQIGDAVSVQGDDYIIDSGIEVADGPSSARFYRLSTNPARWLALIDHEDRFAALLDERSDDTTGSVAAKSWTFSGAGTGGGSGSIKAPATVSMYGTPGEGDIVAFHVVSGADERYLSGNTVHVDDVAVYGKPRL
jgi:hypothetical protein